MKIPFFFCSNFSLWLIAPPTDSRHFQLTESQIFKHFYSGLWSTTTQPDWSGSRVWGSRDRWLEYRRSGGNSSSAENNWEFCEVRMVRIRSCEITLDKSLRSCRRYFTFAPERLIDKLHRIKVWPIILLFLNLINWPDGEDETEVLEITIEVQDSWM